MQKPTKTALNVEARKHILNGIRAIYDPVRMTLGPEGGNALMYRTYGRGPRITNDGKTIAEVIEPKNPFTQLVSFSYKEACQRTDQEAGDGTTSTTVFSGQLGISIINELLSNSEGIMQKTQGVMTVRKELLEAKEQVIEEIKKRAKKIESKEELEQIATVSVEDEKLGKIIADMVWETGEYGHVDVVEGFKGKIETEIIKGMRFPAKVAGKSFVNNAARSEMVMEDCPVFVTNHPMDNVREAGECVSKLLNESKAGKIAILAPNFSEDVLVAFLNTTIKRQQDGTYAKTGIEIYPVHTPSLRTEQYQDIAAYMGAAFIDKNEGKKLQTASVADLGGVEKLIVKDVDAREDAIAIGGAGEDSDSVKERVKELQERIKEGFKVDTHKKLAEKRIASLSAAIGIIRVGAQSQAEGRYLKLKVEDAVYAAQAAMEEGYVKGGGLCLKEIAEELPENRLTASLKRPYEQIQENAGETIEIPDNIIDPAKVVRLTVENGVSVIAHLITVKAIIPEEKDTTPGEGYKAIARELGVQNRLTAKQHNLELERARHEEAYYDQAYEEAAENDND